MRKFQLLISALAFNFQVFAQSTGSIQGKITNQSTKESMPGVTITLKGTTTTAFTNADGEFSLPALPPGNHALIFSHVGYETIELQATVVQGQTAELNASMLVDDRPGSEVVVSASRRLEKITNAPAPIQIISSNEIAEFAGSNVGELVSRLQGVEYTRSGVDEISFNARGMNSAFNIRVFQLVDGRNTMAAASGGLPLFNNGSTQKDDIERIEVVLGPQTALYGPNAHNALFNFITKDPRKYPGTTISVSAGSQYQFSSRVRHAEVINSKLAFKLTAEHLTGQDYKFYDSLYIGPATNPIVIPERNLDFTFKRLRGELHAYYKVLPNTDLIVSGGGSKFTRLQVTTGGHQHLRDVTYSFMQARLVHPRFYATVYNTWGNLGRSLNIGSYSIDFYNATRPGPNQMTPEAAEIHATRLGNQAKERSQRLNAEGQYNYSFEKAGLIVVAGVNYQLERPNGYGINLVDSFERIQITQYGGVLQVEKTLPWQLRFVGATRFDHHSNFGDFLSPRIGLVRKLNDGSIRLTWGKAYSNPSILNQYFGLNRGLFGNGGEGIRYIPNGSIVADPNSVVNTIPVKTEQVRSLEAGFRGRITQKLFADLNFYHSTSNDFVSPQLLVFGRALTVNGIKVTPRTPGTVDAEGRLQGARFGTFFNYGRVKVWGADLGLNYRFNKYFDAAIKYSWIDSDITDDNLSNDANGDGFLSLEERSLNAPNHRGLVMLNLQNIWKERLSLSIITRWVEEYDFYSGSQLGTGAGKGKRGFIARPGLDTLRRNFDWGALGGFTTVDLQAGYQLNPNCRFNISVVNLFNTKQIEFVGSPSVGRLIMAELRLHLPGKTKKNTELIE